MDANLIPLLPAAQVLVTALVVLMRDLFIKEHEPKGILALLHRVHVEGDGGARRESEGKPAVPQHILIVARGAHTQQAGGGLERDAGCAAVAGEIVRRNAGEK